MTDILSQLLELNKRMLAEVRSIRERVGSDATSSVQIATSTRGYDVTVKCYAGSPVREAGDAAMHEYLRLRAEIERRLTHGWADEHERRAQDWAMSNAMAEERAIIGPPEEDQ